MYDATNFKHNWVTNLAILDKVYKFSIKENVNFPLKRRKEKYFCIPLRKAG